MVSAASAATVRVSPSCSGTTEPCLLITDALRSARDGDALLLASGTHTLTEVVLLEGRRRLSIVGEQLPPELEEEEEEERLEKKRPVVIECSDGVGLVAVNCSDISLGNLVVSGCGLKGDGLQSALLELKRSRVGELVYAVPSSLSIAVFLGDCEDLCMENVTVASTVGLGLLGINILGTSVLKNVEFAHNSYAIAVDRCDDIFTDSAELIVTSERESGERLGGGAYFVFQDYYQGEEEATSPSSSSPTPPEGQLVGGAVTFQIEGSSFINNSDCSRSLLNDAYSLSSVSLRELGRYIGAAAGLSIVLAQSQYPVQFTVSQSTFQDNKGVYGSGAVFMVFRHVRNSALNIARCSFTNNGALDGNFSTYAIGGGALAFVNGLSTINELLNPVNQNTSLIVTDSDFTDNRALVGGAIFIYGLYQSCILSVLDTVRFFCQNCTFTENQANYGLAMFATETKLHAESIGLQMELRDMRVIRNRIHGSETNSFLFALDMTPGAITSMALNLTLSGSLVFSGNDGSAISASNSYVGVLGGTVMFEGNTGNYGGALNLINSYFIVVPGSTVVFRNNTAHIRGGAVRVKLNAQVGQSVASFCFLYFAYEEFVYCTNCSDLNSLDVRIEFIQNSAPAGNMVYGSSLFNCPWAAELIETYGTDNVYDILYNNFPEVVLFDSDPMSSVGNRRNVETLPAFLVIEDNENTQLSVTPGQVLNLNVFAIDELGQNVPAIISSYAINANRDISNNFSAAVGSSNFHVLSGNNATKTPVTVLVRQTNPANVTVILFSTESLIESRFALEVVKCPNGFLYSNETLMRCVCDPLLEPRVMCDQETQEFIVPHDYWIGTLDGKLDSELVVAPCVKDYCVIGEKRVSPTNFDSQCGDDKRRANVLCGSCKANYSLSISSSHCLPCSNYRALLLIPFLVAVILFVAAIAYLRITVTAGYINGVIFYFNIYELYSQEFSPGGNLYFPGTLFTLGFGFETCFYNDMSALQRSFWDLMYPAYMFVLLGIITLLARCFKWSRNAGFLTIQMFATLMLLCYTSVLKSCFELLGYTRVSTITGETSLRWIADPNVVYFHSWHAALGLLAIVLVLVYILPMPLLLLFPSRVYRLRYLQKLKPLYDVFWAPFEPRYRFWLGMRLIVRWVAYGLQPWHLFPTDALLVGTVIAGLTYSQLLLRPFKGLWRNVWDSLFLLNLNVLFLSSLHFEVKANILPEDERVAVYREQFAFSTTFLVIAYIVAAGIIVFHVIDRFPKLKTATGNFIYFLKNRKRRERKPGASAASQIDSSETEDSEGRRRETFVIEHLSDGNATVTTRNTGLAKVISFTELREPLLDYPPTEEERSAVNNTA